MATSSSYKDKFSDNVINPYQREVMQHPQAIQMRDGVLHIRGVQGRKGTRSVEAKLEAKEQEVFRCKGMVERGLYANHLMIVDYTCDLKVDGKSMKDIVFSLNEQINFLHSQIHDLQSQVFEYEASEYFSDDTYLSTMGIGSNNSHCSRTNEVHQDDHEYEVDEDGEGMVDAPRGRACNTTTGMPSSGGCENNN
ncbi:40S ribosomal protein S5-1 [Hordeum vulgare]|nr:40S ribosomal protein S5-1 [Hordeum vulgare]